MQTHRSALASCLMHSRASPREIRKSVRLQAVFDVPRISRTAAVSGGVRLKRQTVGVRNAELHGGKAGLERREVEQLFGCVSECIQFPGADMSGTIIAGSCPRNVQKLWQTERSQSAPRDS